jgi:hypothetical protein
MLGMRMMAVVVTALAVLGSAAKVRTTRSKLRCADDEAAPVSETVVAAADTLRGVEAARLITVSGYEKPLRSRHETMLVTNNDSVATVSMVSLDITYYDMQGRTLHRRTASTAVDLPPRTTRLVDLKSWDVNTLFYYHLNVPTRTSTQATPYRVSVLPTEIVLTDWR